VRCSGDLDRRRRARGARSRASWAADRATLPPRGIAIGSDPSAALKSADALVDFTDPRARSRARCRAARRR
jgi:hypothetical protein